MAGRSVRVRVEVFKAVVDGQAGPGGGGFDTLKQANRDVFRLSVALSTRFARTGDITRSHVNAGVLRVGRASARSAVNNTSPHAPFKHDGTQGPIRPNNSARLKLPAGPNTSGRIHIFPFEVRGQVGDPWMFRAGQIVAARLGGVATRR